MDYVVLNLINKRYDFIAEKNRNSLYFIFFLNKNRCQSKEAPAEGSRKAGPGAAERKSHVQGHVFLQT